MCNKISVIAMSLLLSGSVMANQQSCGYFESWHGLFPYFVKCNNIVIKIPTQETDDKD